MRQRPKPTSENDAVLALAQRISTVLTSLPGLHVAPEEVTLHMVADLCWALNVCPHLELNDPDQEPQLWDELAAMTFEDVEDEPSTSEG